MDLSQISLEPIRRRKVAVIGYGNQGRAHALNLRDSGVSVLVGARPGPGANAAMTDGFEPLDVVEAVSAADVVMLLLPDQVIPGVYRQISPLLVAGARTVGFAHGFAFHYKLINPLPVCSYFLVGPKGAGAILRENYKQGGGLPAVFAVAPGSDESTRDLAMSYAKAIGGATSVLLETTFREETECDLFGEQAVLCGGIMALMEQAYEVLRRKGHSPEMAFFECCYEAKVILDLFLKFGPTATASRISPTAFFGGLTRGKRLVTEETRAEMEKIFDEVRSGAFAREWMAEVQKGMPALRDEKERLATSSLQAVYDSLKEKLGR